MADIRINQLPEETSPVASENVAIDASSTRRVTIQRLVDAGAPVASQAEAEAGTNAIKRMTPLTTKQQIDSRIGTGAGQIAAGDDSRIVNAVPNSLTLTAGAGIDPIGDLTANRTVSLSAASQASLALADTSVQPARTVSAGTGLTGGGTLASDRTIALSAGSIASLALADTSLQPAAIGVSVQAFSASLAAIATPGTQGTLATRTTRLNLPTSGGGSMYAFGRNGSNAGANYNGLQIGGGLVSDGPDGVFLAPDEHASWTRFQPSKNYSAIETVFYSTSAQGFASKVNGTNQFTVTSGTTPDATWIGEKFYWEAEIYKISGVAGSTITVTTTGGGAVTHSGSASGVWHVFYVEGTGLCNVSGTTVTRVSGDPFIPFFTAPFHMTINGSVVTVNSFTNNSQIGLSASPGNGTNLPYVWRTDIDNTLVQMRLQSVIGTDEENLTLGVKPWGNFIRTQIAGSGIYRPLYLGAGNDKAQISLMADGKIRFGDHGKIIDPAAATTNYVEFDSGTGGTAPSFRARGVATNVGIAFDAKGTGNVTFTSGSFGRTNFRIYGSAGTDYLVVDAVTGAPYLAAEGASANIDIPILAKGTGVVRFGTWTSNADAAVNGYITVKDAAGNTRKLATIA